MMKLMLILNAWADQVGMKLSFDERLGKEDCFISCERFGMARSWRLIYKLNQHTEAQIVWLL
jgi:hypothetical protein